IPGSRRPGRGPVPWRWAWVSPGPPEGRGTRVVLACEEPVWVLAWPDVPGASPRGSRWVPRRWVGAPTRGAPFRPCRQQRSGPPSAPRGRLAHRRTAVARGGGAPGPRETWLGLNEQTRAARGEPSALPG